MEKIKLHGQVQFSIPECRIARKRWVSTFYFMSGPSASQETHLTNQCSKVGQTSKMPNTKHTPMCFHSMARLFRPHTHAAKGEARLGSCPQISPPTSQQQTPWPPQSFSIIHHIHRLQVAFNTLHPKSTAHISLQCFGIYTKSYLQIRQRYRYLSIYNDQSIYLST